MDKMCPFSGLGVAALALDGLSAERTFCGLALVPAVGMASRRSPPGVATKGESGD